MISPMRVLHLGLGAFHRAHQAAYLQDLRDSGDFEWQLAGGNLRADQSEVEAALLAQDGEYTLETVASDGAREYRRIDAIRTVVPLAPGHERLVALAAAAATRIISCTVTEAGYYLGADGRLDVDSMPVSTDFARLRRGVAGNTIYGALAAILERRRRDQAGGVTLLSCDNLRHNGDQLRVGLEQFLRHADNEPLLEWTSEHCTFPNSMVDRITPRPDSQVRARVLAATGFDDAAAVMSESFRQWVIEDKFAGERPAWESVGVRIVASVEPFEEAKIRILNASHSAIAWAGVLLGTSFIHEGVRDPRIRAIANAYVSDDVIPCLSPSPLDLAAYRDAVFDRFGNAALADSNQRVAADSFAKLREFIVPTLRQRLRAGAPIAGVAMLPALFLAFLQRWQRGELPFTHSDQDMDPGLAHRICADGDPVRALAFDASTWGDLCGDETLILALRAASARVELFAQAVPA